MPQHDATTERPGGSDAVGFVIWPEDEPEPPYLQPETLKALDDMIDAMIAWREARKAAAK